MQKILNLNKIEICLKLPHVRYNDIFMKNEHFHDNFGIVLLMIKNVWNKVLILFHVSIENFLGYKTYPYLFL